MVSCPRLNASTTSWLPRRADQKVTRVFLPVLLLLLVFPVLLVLPDRWAPSLPLQALSAPVRGSAAIVASTDRRLCRPGMSASRGS
ncbi:hypothetical protein GCM10010392_60750 [Streptomyces clavifer]|nr:hypothetical protein GCM10010392_60750 [Streptomyces clavifer]